MGGTLKAEIPRGVLEEISRKRANSAWLDKHRDELRAEFPDKYVAVLDERVVGDSPDFRALLAKLRKRFAFEELAVAAIDYISPGDVVWVL